MILAPRRDGGRPLLEYAAAVVRALREDGLEVEPVVFGPEPTALANRWRRLAGKPPFPTDLRARVESALPGCAWIPYWPLPGRSLQSAARSVARHLRGRPPSVLLGSLLDEAGFVAAAVARRLGRPAVVVAHGSDVTRWVHRPRAPSAVRSSWTLRKASAVVAVSDALAEPLRSVGLQVEVVPFTVFGRDFALAPLPALEEGPKLLFVGRLGPAKGFDVAVELLDALPRARLTAVGPREPGVRLPDHPRFRWLGVRSHSEVAPVYREHHLLVHPSRAEGLGNVLVESLLVGRPVVARSVGGIPEVVDPKVGALVTGDDPAAWAQAVEAVWGRLARGDLAPERLRRWGMRFAWEASGPQLGKLLRRVGAGRGLDEPAAGR